jgi:PAS domain-containing protein
MNEPETNKPELIIRPDLWPNMDPKEAVQLLNHVQDAIVKIYLGERFRVGYANEALADLTRYSLADFVENPGLFFEIVYPDDLPAVSAMLRDSSLETAVFRLQRKDGEVVLVAARLAPVLDRLDHSFNAVVLSLRPISDRPTARESSVRRTDLNRDVIHTMEEAMAVIRLPGGIFEDANQTFIELFFLERDGIRGVEILTLLSRHIDPGDLARLRDALAANQLDNLEIPVQNRYGSGLFLYFEKRAHPADAGDSILVRTRSFALFKKLSHYVDKLSVIGEAGFGLSQTLNLEDIYQRTGNAVERLFPDVGTIIISRFHPESATFTAAYAWQDSVRLDISDLPPVALEPPGRGVQSQAVHSRAPVIIDDLYKFLAALGKKVVYLGDDESDTITRSALCVPMLAQDRVLGVVQVQAGPLNRFSGADADILSVISNNAAVMIANTELVDDLRRSNRELSEAYDATLKGWVQAIDLRDSETRDHTQRVADLTLRLARRMGFAGDPLVHLYRGVLLHDIGKLIVPDDILRKPDKLSAEEWVVMKLHPVRAKEMIEEIPYLQPALEIPYSHHEKWDGSGYPRGLKGAEIPLTARIFAVVDVYDALSHDRPYNQAWSLERVRAHILSLSGIHFDPQVVEAFIGMLDEGDGDHR